MARPIGRSLFHVGDGSRRPGHPLGASISVARGILFAVGSFVVLDTVAALWPNPLFMRMTPTGGFEVALLAAQSVLLGVYLAIPMPACATKLAGIGGVASFLGVACPICNKILLFLFGAQTLLTYLEPVRIYLAAGGVLVTAIAVAVRLSSGAEFRRRREESFSPRLRS